MTNLLGPVEALEVVLLLVKAVLGSIGVGVALRGKRRCRARVCESPYLAELLPEHKAARPTCLTVNILSQITHVLLRTNRRCSRNQTENMSAYGIPKVDIAPHHLKSVALTQGESKLEENQVGTLQLSRSGLRYDVR